MSRLTPQQLGEIWTRLLRETSRREKCRATAKRQPAPPRPGFVSFGLDGAQDPVQRNGENDSAHPLAENPRYDGHPLAEREGDCTRDDDIAASDPIPKLAALFKQLLDGFRDVMNGDDEDDGPFAESILSDLEPHYADLLEFLDDRQEFKARRATARQMRDEG